MKRTVKALLIVSALVFCVIFLAACKGAGKEYRVMVSLSEGVSVDGDNPVTVPEGGSASFKMVIEDGYVLVSCDGGSYDYETGMLTVSDVRKNTNVDFIVEEYGYDPNEKFVYLFRSDFDGDLTSVKPSSSVASGTLITVTANDTSRLFLGWSFGASHKNGGELVSTERSYTFRLTPVVADDGVLTVYANYSEINSITYNANGGKINTGTVNAKGNAHTTVTQSGDEVTVALSEEYLSYMECASSFWDDGTFERDGYVLTEYNTRPDGTGTAYSLGSKVPMLHGSEATTLYCIWAAATEAHYFETKSATYACPTDLKNAPNWVENGVVITEYLGNAHTVVIPEKIDGQYVIGIAAGAFSDCDMTTLVLNKRILYVEDGAFVGCDSIATVYFPDGIYSINNEAFDEASYTSLTHLNVNATIAPRYNGADTGALSVKLSRLLAPTNKNRIIVIAGSSSYQGLGTEYLEALLEDEYRVINFGTTRTTHGIMYLEAMKHLAREGDVILYAPENSSYMLGESELYYKTLRDLESMINIYRYVDISAYTNVFGAFTELNQKYRYGMAPRTYEEVCERGRQSEYEAHKGITNSYGDYLKSDRTALGNYYDSYFITLNEFVKSRNEGAWNDVDNQHANSNYSDPNNETWCNITDPYYLDMMNRAISAAKESGARVYFSFCPVDADKLVEGAGETAWQTRYDELILDNYSFDGIVGTCSDYIFAHGYFYDNAFHLNDYGRTVRTYQLYLDLCELLGVTDRVELDGVGTEYDGCLFE